MPGQTTDKARLGVFVVSGIVLAVAGVLALGAGRLFEKTVPVHCYFTESVQGLESGSPISYRGVTVGRVVSIAMRRPANDGATAMHQAAIIEVTGALVPESFQESSVSFDVERTITDALKGAVDRGLRVQIAWKDITGQKYLDLDFHDPEEAVPPKLPVEPAVPYIPTYVSASFQDIQKDLATTLSNLAKIRYDLIGAKVEIALERLTTRIEEMRTDEISSSVRGAADALRTIAESPGFRDGLLRFDAISQETEKIGRRLNEILERPELDAAVGDLAAASASLRTTMASLETQLPATVAKLDLVIDDVRLNLEGAKIPETTASIREGVDSMGAAARNVTAVRTELVAALRELTQASRSIGRLAEYLERHPDALLEGRAASGGK